MPGLIDSHQHFWDLSRFEYPWMTGEELEPLQRNYLPADLEPLLRPAGVDQTVFVQAQHNLDESRQLSPCSAVGATGGDVSHATGLETLLRHYRQIRGLRRLSDDNADSHPVRQPGWRRPSPAPPDPGLPGVLRRLD
jgi:L-fuconolactonase